MIDARLLVRKGADTTEYFRADGRLVTTVNNLNFTFAFQFPNGDKVECPGCSSLQDFVDKINKYGELLDLLKECLPIVSAEIMTWQIRGGEESYKRGQELLTRIKAAIDESEEQ